MKIGSMERFSGIATGNKHGKNKILSRTMICAEVFFKQTCGKGNKYDLTFQGLSQKDHIDVSCKQTSA